MGNTIKKNQLYGVHVINLDTKKDRFDYIDNVLEQGGMDYKRVSAVNGKQFDTVPKITASQGYPDLECLGNIKRNENLAHTGCYMSHLKCIKMIAEGQDNFGLILEDDAKFIVPDFKRVIDEIISDNLGIDIIWFNAPSETEVIQKYEMPTWGTQGYMLSKRGAKLLYNVLKPGSEWIHRKEECLFDLILPIAVRDTKMKWKVFSLITQNKNFTSSISNS